MSQLCERAFSSCQRALAIVVTKAPWLPGFIPCSRWPQATEFSNPSHRLPGAGDQYEGEWAHGQENGIGTTTAADGASFYGRWVDGRMHGEGVSFADQPLAQ